MRMRRILEFGGLHGYSAVNFIRALDYAPRDEPRVVYSVDICDVKICEDNTHRAIIKDASLITAEDVDNEPLDLVIFDCHAYDAEMRAFWTLKNAGGRYRPGVP